MACKGHNGGSDGDGMVDEGAAAGYTHMRARRGEATYRHKHCTDGDGMVDEGVAAGYTHMRARRGEATDRHKHCTDGMYVLACFFSRLS
jgi:predicted choloylglycine hydrolase